MGALPGDRNLEAVDRGHHGTASHGELSCGEARPIVHAINRRDWELVEQAVVDHDLCTAGALLRRLENEMHDAIKLARFGEVLGRTQQHGGVPIVATRVHFVVVDRPVLKVVRFLDG